MITDEVVDRLRTAGCVFADDEAILLREAAGDDHDRLGRLVDARVAGQPLEQLLGWVAFAGLRLAVGPGAFVPRVRTELLAELTLSMITDGSVAVELCCGAAQVVGWRRGTPADALGFGRLGFRALLYAGLPGWFLMRFAGEWVASREGWGDVDEEPAWLGIGYITGEAGGLLLLISVILGGLGVRSLKKSGADSSTMIRVSTVLVAIVLIAYLVAMWAMSAKPD